jgi:hypothetical protein
MTSVPRFYVYILSRPNGKPFYVGKGKGRRLFKHEGEARNGCTCRKCKVIQGIWKNGGEVQRTIVLTTDDEQTALDHERELIALFGKHTLTNITDGGKGVPGYVFTPEVRAKISAAGKGRIVSEQARKNLSNALKGHVHSDDTKAKLRTAAKARAQTEEGRLHLAAAGKKANNADARKRQSETMKALMADPERIAAHSARIKAYFQTDEAKQRQSAAQRRRYADPEQREKARLIAQERVRKQQEAKRQSENA